MRASAAQCRAANRRRRARRETERAASRRDRQGGYDAPDRSGRKTRESTNLDSRSCVWLAGVRRLASSPGRTPAGCEPAGDIRFICDLIGPEDLAVVPGGEWVVASGNQEGGRIHLVNVADKTTSVLFPAPDRTERLDAAAYPGCPGPLDRGRARQRRVPRARPVPRSPARATCTTCTSCTTAGASPSRSSRSTPARRR